ncbi:MAG TPA: hypothetical protein VK914_05590 [bacterium]|nr:hypothetical protein [bacterium]
MEQLREDLLRRGVPGTQVRRTIRELEDHVADARLDLESQGNSPARARELALERLGEAGTLAESICGELGQRTWPGRHPKLSLALLPLGIQLVVLVLWVIAFYALGKCAQHLFLSGTMDFARYQSLLSISAGALYLTATALGAAFLLWLHRRGNGSLGWAGLSIGLLSLLSLICKYYLGISPEPGKSVLCIGPVGNPDPYHPGGLDWLRFAVPLVLMALIYRENIAHRLRRS